jgi:hypothetical protein
LNQYVGDISYSAEVVAFLCMLYFYSKHRTRRSLLLLVLLGVVVLVESINKFHRFQDTSWHVLLINSIVVTEIVCYALFYRWSISNRRHCTMIDIGSILFIVLAICNSLFLQPLLGAIQTYTYILGALLVLSCILLYFNEVIMISSSTFPLHRRYYLLISTGLFVFLAAEIPIMMILNYMVAHDISVADWPIIHVKMITSTFYYSIYAFGLLWAKME